MELLVVDGIDGVKIVPLAERLGVTSGSFYWHFEDHDDLLRSMLDWWDREMTDSVIRIVNASRGGVERRLMAVAEERARRRCFSVTIFLYLPSPL